MKKILIVGLIFLIFINLSNAITINSYSPQELSTNINEGSSQLFTQTSLGSNLTYSWELYKNNGAIIDTPKITFIRQKQIFEMNSDGTNQRQLTFAPDPNPHISYDSQSAISQEGTEIAFIRNNEIWKMNSAGTNLLQLAQREPINSTDTFQYPSWDNNFNIFYQKGNEIWKMDKNGNNKIQLTFRDPPNATNYDSYSQPKVSPDGSKVVFIKSGVIWVMNSDGSNQLQLTQKDSWRTTYINPTWIFDGTKIAYVKKLDYQKEGEVFTINPDGIDQRLLLQKVPSNSTEGYNTPCWVSNNEIIYERNQELYKINTLTNLLSQLTFKDPFNVTNWDTEQTCSHTGTNLNLLLIQQSNAENFTFSPVSGEAGSYILKLTVSDGIDTKNIQWNIKVDPYIAPAVTGDSVSSGGGGRISKGKSIVNTSTIIVEQQNTLSSEQESNTQNTNEGNPNGITGAAVTNTESSGIFNFFSNIWNWLINLF